MRSGRGIGIRASVTGDTGIRPVRPLSGVPDGGLPAPARTRSRARLVRRALVLADASGLLIGFFLTEALFRHTGANAVGFRSEALIFVATLPVWLLAADLYGLYQRDDERADHSTVDDFVNVFHLITVGVWLFFAGSWFAGLSNPDAQKLATFWVLAIAFVVTARALARGFTRKRVAYLQNTIIVGAGDVGQLIGRKLLHHPEYGINLVGFVDAEPKARRPELRHLPMLGALDDLPEIVERLAVERVVIAFSNDRHDTLLRLIHSVRQLPVQVDLVPRLFEAVGPSVGIHNVEGIPLIGLTPVRHSHASTAAKRALDIAGAGIGLVLAAPLLLLIALWIRLESPGPILYRQTRLGMKMREFTLLKFRTMAEDTDDAPHREYIKAIMEADAGAGSNKLYKLERADSVTRTGRWLRRFSLDELPQLWNVLRGDMALVGPRPCLPYETENFAPHHFERFAVPAGLTGLWQVSARAHSTFGEALEMDVVYVRSWSLALDLRLLCRTPLLVLRASNTT